MVRSRIRSSGALPCAGINLPAAIRGYAFGRASANRDENRVPEGSGSIHGPINPIQPNSLRPGDAIAHPSATCTQAAIIPSERSAHNTIRSLRAHPTERPGRAGTRFRPPSLTFHSRQRARREPPVAFARSAGHACRGRDSELLGTERRAERIDPIQPQDACPPAVKRTREGSPCVPSARDLICGTGGTRADLALQRPPGRITPPRRQYGRPGPSSSRRRPCPE